LPSGKGVALNVYSSTGACVYNQAITSPTVNLRLNSLSKGLYIVKINTTEGMVVRKMIIQD